MMACGDYDPRRYAAVTWVGCGAPRPPDPPANEYMAGPPIDWSGFWSRHREVFGLMGEAAYWLALMLGVWVFFCVVTPTAQITQWILVAGAAFVCWILLCPARKWWAKQNNAKNTWMPR